jgi:hypothetical protein
VGGVGKTNCASPPGSDQGVTSSQIKVAIILINLGGAVANSTFGLMTPDEQKSDYQTVINSMNASGGVACRQLAPVFLQGNPIDQSNLQQDCLTIQQDGVFAAFDLGVYTAFPALVSCYSSSHIPFFSIDPATEVEMQHNYPYFFSTYATLDLLYHNMVFGLKSRGFFEAQNGFQKLGFFYKDCDPQLISEMMTWLHQAGLSSSQIVTYDNGCPATAITAAGIIQSAVLKFKQAGVTNVTEVEDVGPDFDTFTKIAQQQDFHPKYGIAQDGTIATGKSPLHPDFANIPNAVGITDDRYGEESTPGSVPSAGTAKCNAIYAAVGAVPVYQAPTGDAGQICDQLWMFQAAVEHSKAMQRSDLAAGLQTAGSVEFSYPMGPNDFTPPKVTYGNEYWRTLQFMPSCSCWQVIDPTFHKSFPGVI